MTLKILITGIPVSSTLPVDLPVRRNLRNLIEAPDVQGRIQFSLFVRALTVLKAKPITDILGYFQIAGIHSEPRVSWNGVDPAGKEFCAHSTNTFPTWHRPYLLLFEQTLWKVMKEEVIPKVKPKTEQEWNKAADTFRLPYWDWATPEDYTDGSSLPACFTGEHLSIIDGQGRMENVPSPFWSFVNPLLKDGQPVPFGDDAMGANKLITDNIDVPFGKTWGISRYGLKLDANGTWNGFAGVNNWKTANEELEHPAFYGIATSSFCEAVNRMLNPGNPNKHITWRDFACCRRSNMDHMNYMSLEYIHNNVHNITGGSNGKTKGVGHVSELAIAAFDPIFWLHHCNIDRLTAFYQQIYPEHWFDGTPSGEDQPGAAATLEPFYKDDQNLYTSEAVKDYNKLGYEYDDLVPTGDSWQDGQIVREKYAQQVRQRVKELYPSTANIVNRDIQMPGLLTDEDKFFNDYVLNVLYDRFALNGKSYSIRFFIGNSVGTLADREARENEADNLAGSVFSFSRNPQRCSNCKRSQTQEELCGAQILLTTRLLKRFKRDISYVIRRSSPYNADGTLLSMEPDHVSNFLQKNLNWEFLDVKGQIRDPSEFPKTKVFVLQGKGKIYNKGRGVMPEYSGYTLMAPATEGKTGGGVGANDPKLGTSKWS